MQICNRIVYNYSALAKRSMLAATHIRPFSISACQYAEKKSNEEEPRSVTHNYFESLKDYDEENSESYSKDRVEGSFWGGDPGQTKQPGDENDVSTWFMHRLSVAAHTKSHCIYPQLVNEKSPNVHETYSKDSKTEKDSARGVKKWVKHYCQGKRILQHNPNWIDFVHSNWGPAPYHH